MSRVHTPQRVPVDPAGWRWPLDLAAYDRSPELSPAERLALGEWLPRWRITSRARPRGAGPEVVERLRRPLVDALLALGCIREDRGTITYEFLAGVAERGVAFWGWSSGDWAEHLRSLPRFTGQSRTPARIYYLGVAYLLGDFIDFERTRLRAGVGSGVFVRALACAVFGQPAVEAALARVAEALERIGYSQRFRDGIRYRGLAVCYALLLSRSPHLEDITPETMEGLQGRGRRACTLPRYALLLLPGISRALVELGILRRPLEPRSPSDPSLQTLGRADPEWAAWCARWRELTTGARKQELYSQALQAGQWLGLYHPEITRPDQWTRPLCAGYVAAVLALKVGDWARVTSHVSEAKRGQALAPRTKNALLYVLRRMFRELRDWGLLTLRIDPARDLATPRAIRDLIGPDARVIDDALWLKLVWASLNLSAEDLERHGASRYPLELVRAAAVVWTHAALRSDEIYRLRLGCIRPQTEAEIDPDTGEVLPAHSVCYLDVPPNKTSPGYTKPVAPAVAEAIAAWEAIRPHQPLTADRKSGEPVHRLFALRGRKLGAQYLNQYLIPLLCAKAGVPREDSRGRITSHRARASILNRLKSGLSLYELQQYAGHKSPLSTVHYLARVEPTQLARAFLKADTTSRMIEVLIDHEAVRSGAAAKGEPWMYYDLGPAGFCSNVFWSQCPHRLACAGCDFNVPKSSARAEALRAKAFLQRYKQEVPLTEAELEAIEGDAAKFDLLLRRLEDVPTPDGRTPREITAAREATPRSIPLPILPHPHP